MRMRRARRKWLLGLVADRVNLLESLMARMEEPPESIDEFMDALCRDRQLPMPFEAIMRAARSAGFISGVGAALGVIDEDLIAEAKEIVGH